MKGRIVYDIIIISFILSFIGYTMFSYLDWLTPVWIGFAIIGCISFVARIVAGHD